MEKRPAPPGQHGARRRTRSDFGQQLLEKQRLKFQYNVSERQLRKYFADARRLKGSTGEQLLHILESRLDNMVYRAGFAATIYSARQLVSHRHILVNGELLNIPSYQVKSGDVISVREKSKSMEVIADSLSGRRGEYSWLQWNDATQMGTFTGVPGRDLIPENIKEQLIVELYSK